MQKVVIFVKKNLKKQYAKGKNYRKVRDHYTGEYRGAVTQGNIEVLNIASVI